MGNKNVFGRVTARRAATFLGALGALVMSSGVALMVAATPATAAQGEHVPVNICHATSSDTNPYVFITVDDDSAKLKGHLKHRNDPNKRWKSDGTWEGKSHVKDELKPDLIASFVDSNGVSHALDGNITSASCDDTGEVEVPPAVADVDFTDPACDNNNEASFDTTGAHVEFKVTEGSAAPGQHIKIVATADKDYMFDDESVTQTFEHTFGSALNLTGEPCQRVSVPNTPPQTVVSPPQTKSETKTKAKAKAEAVTPTVVHAGLAGVSTEDMRGEQGLALMFAGMVMLVAAGGLGLRVRGAASRS